MEIKLEKRVKYAGDIHTELVKAGFTPNGAAELLNHVPDAHTAVSVLADLDDQVSRKLESARKDWKYSGKYGDGFKDALLVVRSMIHAAKKREGAKDA